MINIYKMQAGEKKMSFLSSEHTEALKNTYFFSDQGERMFPANRKINDYKIIVWESKNGKKYF